MFGCIEWIASDPRPGCLPSGADFGIQSFMGCRTDEQMEQIIKFSKGIHFFKYITNAQVAPCPPRLRRIASRTTRTRSSIARLGCLFSVRTGKFSC